MKNPKITNMSPANNGSLRHSAIKRNQIKESKEMFCHLAQNSTNRLKKNKNLKMAPRRTLTDAEKEENNRKRREKRAQEDPQTKAKRLETIREREYMFVRKKKGNNTERGSSVAYIR